jgi:hypothetical protein
MSESESEGEDADGADADGADGAEHIARDSAAVTDKVLSLV